MNRTRTIDNHDMSVYKQASGSIYGLLDHEKHENHTLPVNPNFLTFSNKTLNKKLAESLYRDVTCNGPSIEFKNNMLFFYIFHTSYLLISLFTNILLYTNNYQSYSHFSLRITFVSIIFTISYLILFLLLKFYSLLNHSRLLFSGLGVLMICYLVVCDERVLSGISGQVYQSSCSTTVISIGLYIVIFRYVLLDSFLFLILLSIFALALTLIGLMVFSTVSVLSGVSDFLILLVFLVIELMETHQIDLRTRQLFWRKQMEEEYLDNIDNLDREDTGFTNINTEIEILIQWCEKIKQTIKTVTAVIMYKDVKNKLKSAQNDLEKVKRQMALGGFANVVKLEQHPGISEEDKLFIVQNFTNNNPLAPKRSRLSAKRLNMGNYWSVGNSEIENLLGSVGNYWNLDIWFIYSSTGSSLHIIGKHLLDRWRLVEGVGIPEQACDAFFMTLERVSTK